MITFYFAGIYSGVNVNPNKVEDVITFYFNGIYSAVPYPINSGYDLITFNFIGIYSTIYEHNNNKKNTSVCV